MSIQEFFDKYNNRGIDFDNYYGQQCMDLAHQYAVEVVGQDIPAAPGAKDVWGKDCPRYDKITNTPDGVPQKGDIVIWGTAIGPYGHIAVFDHGDINSFVSFDQNWPINSLCHLQNHNYTGVLGWLHPKGAVQTQPQTQDFDIEDLMRASKIVKEWFAKYKVEGNYEGWANALCQDAWPIYLKFKKGKLVELTLSQSSTASYTTSNSAPEPQQTEYTLAGLLGYLKAYVRKFTR